MSAEKAVLLLGRRDQPTDGVADYCERLREAAFPLGIEFELISVPWAEKGWRVAQAELRQAAEGWRDRWVLLQFTTLAWSRRGFPLRAPRVLEILRRCGARPGVVFHDISPLPGSGMVGNIRELCQQRAFHRLYSFSDLAIFTAPINKVLWLPLRREKAVFIPVGSNLPELGHNAKNNDKLPTNGSTVVVFGITGGAEGEKEVCDIAYALKSVQSKGIPLRLVAIGRGAAVFEEQLRTALNSSGVTFSMLGLLPSQGLVQALAGAQVLLSVRGQVSSRRSSVIAGIACGLPIVGYRGAETTFPVTEAGVKLVERGDREGLARVLGQVLADEKLYRELRHRSLDAEQKYFRWDVVASQFASALSSQ